MIQFGIQNAILECDLAAPYINWDKWVAECVTATRGYVASTTLRVLQLWH